MFTIHVELSKTELSRKKGLAAAGLHRSGTHDCLSQLLLTHLIAICPNQLEELDVCGRNLLQDTWNFSVVGTEPPQMRMISKLIESFFIYVSKTSKTHACWCYSTEGLVGNVLCNSSMTMATLITSLPFPLMSVAESMYFARNCKHFCLTPRLR